MTPLAPGTLDVFPRLGWAQDPSPLTPLPDLAQALGLDSLHVKRDDLLPELGGGTKTRKLDFLLATPELATPRWVSVGALGSGHLVALVAAARRLQRDVETHLFWEPLSPGVRENLAFTASWSAQLCFHRTRETLALRHPGLLWGRRHPGGAVVPPGATSAAGMLGTVRAGLELAAQVRAGLVPAPDQVVAALGSGGLVTGLARGLALGGVRCTLRAVATVEHVYSLDAWRRHLDRQLVTLLSRAGIPAVAPVPVVVDRAHLGRGYGHPTAASLRACGEGGARGLPLEAVYTGKAWAALGPGPRHVVFWLSSRRGGALETRGDWLDRLPAALRVRLQRS